MMLQAIELTNFKCYEALDLPCSALTVLTGYNAAGKSTVLEALLLLAQGLRTAANEKNLPLNGDLVCLGCEDDVLRHGAAEPSFTLGVRSAEERIRWTFGSRKGQSNNGFVPLRALEYGPGCGGEVAGSQEPERIWPARGEAESPLAFAVRDAAYVGAARGVPPSGFPAPRKASRPTGEVDAASEFAPHWYVEYADEDIDPNRNRCHSQGVSGTASAQVDGWLSELFPGAGTSADRPSPDAIRLSFPPRSASPGACPANAGSGLSAVLPMLVALLTREQGSIVMVGLPGVSSSSPFSVRRRAVLGADGRHGACRSLSRPTANTSSTASGLPSGMAMCSRKTALHFVSQDGVAGRVTTLAVDQNGAVSDWPKGFFDQAENDLAALSGWHSAPCRGHHLRAE